MKEQIDEKHALSESIYMSGHGLDWRDSDDIAEQLYNAGYRKQEWISVDERLPEEGKNVLCFDGDKTSIAFMEKVEDCGTYVPIFWDFVFYDRDDTWNEVCATHWMPLPEAPKMKGGE